jgi:hypothetical protein
MQVSFFNRLFAYMQGKKVVELYSSATLRSYFTVAIRNNQNQWICQIPRYDKQWEFDFSRRTDDRRRFRPLEVNPQLVSPNLNSLHEIHE